jgi:galactose mutarotase-like enzyme
VATIKSDRIEVSAKAMGTELSSIRSKDSVEYLWQADPAFWTGQAPLLFPSVGNLPGKTYRLENHGFLRKREFSLEEAGTDSMTFAFTSDEQSLALYPFRFSLAVRFRVKASTLSVEWTVRNADDKAMYFSIGAHPGFRAPLVPGEKRGDYELVFEKKEDAKRHYLTADNVLSGETGPFLEGKDRIRVSEDIFERGAVVLKDHRSRKVTLRSTVSSRFVTVDFPGFPYLGIWSPKGEAPFVCIEPWHGVMPLEGSTQDLKAKEGVIALEPGREFRSVYEITVG